MQAVKEYIFSLMIISISCSVVNMLAPKGTDLQRYSKFLISLIITVVILSPLGSLMGEIPKLSNNGIDIDIYNGEIEVMSAEELVIDEACAIMENRVTEHIKSKLSLTPKRVEVTCNSDDYENIRVEKVTVIYENENEFLFSDTQKLISELFMDECEVICRVENDK